MKKPADLDLHCLQRQGISRFSRTRVKVLQQKVDRDSDGKAGMVVGILIGSPNIKYKRVLYLFIKFNSKIDTRLVPL